MHVAQAEGGGGFRALCTVVGCSLEGVEGDALAWGEVREFELELRVGRALVGRGSEVWKGEQPAAHAARPAAAGCGNTRAGLGPGACYY